MYFSVYFSVLPRHYYPVKSGYMVSLDTHLREYVSYLGVLTMRTHCLEVDVTIDDQLVIFLHRLQSQIKNLYPYELMSKL